MSDTIERRIQHLCNMITESIKRHANRKLNSYVYPKVIGVWISKENITTRISADDEVREIYRSREKTKNE